MTTAGVDQVLPGEATSSARSSPPAADPDWDRDAVHALRDREYSRLDGLGQVFLDYTGGGLYAQSQLRRAPAPAASRRLRQPALGQPGVGGLDAASRTRARASILAFFNASPDEYDVVFTANATAALRLVGESYPFEPGGRLLLTADNHNSVNGIREFARAQRRAVDLRPALDARPARRRRRRARRPRPGHAGVRACSPTRRSPTTPASATRSPGSTPPTSAAGTSCSTRRHSCPRTGSTSTRWRPDFVAVSWYKVFGYPTGIGSLRRAPRSPSPAAASVVRGRQHRRRVGGRAAATPGPPARRGSRTARSTTWACRASRSGCDTSTRSACPSIHRRVPVR